MPFEFLPSLHSGSCIIFELITFVDCTVKVLVVILMVSLNEFKFMAWLDTCLIVGSRYNCSFGRRVLVDGAYFLALASASLFSSCRWGRACTSARESLGASLGPCVPRGGFDAYFLPMAFASLLSVCCQGGSSASVWIS